MKEDSVENPFMFILIGFAVLVSVARFAILDGVTVKKPTKTESLPNTLYTVLAVIFAILNPHAYAGLWAFCLVYKLVQAKLIQLISDWVNKKELNFGTWS